MARLARVVATGHPHHVTPRGNRRLREGGKNGIVLPEFVAARRTSPTLLLKNVGRGAPRQSGSNR